MSALSTKAGWEKFLSEFAATLHATEWPGNAASSEESLLNAESRLKIALPPSYRAFLSVSNGWRNASRFIAVLRPVEKIRWLNREHRDWVRAYTQMGDIGPLLPSENDYFNYAQEGGTFETKHLAHTLCISDVGDDAVLLLNPMVIWPDGEWEAWFFANWVPGAVRYRSFADWMRHELDELGGDVFAHSTVPGELPTIYLDGPAKAKRRVRPREECLRVEEALNRLSSKKRTLRVKAVRQLGRAGGQTAITALLGLLKNDYDRDVRCEAAEMLGRMHADEAIRPLIEATAIDSYILSSAAVEALGYFNDEISARHLVKLVEEDGNRACLAVHALARRNDPRGIPPLVQKLISKHPHAGDTAGRSIAEFGEAGFLALEPLAEHEEVQIRDRAVSGIFDAACLAKDKQLKMRALNLLERCLEKETREVKRHHLESCIAVASNDSRRLHDITADLRGSPFD